MKQAVIIIGGYNSLWPTYFKMARDLEDLTGLQTIAVPLMPWHWWITQRNRDATNVLTKLEETVAWAGRRFRADQLILVGHSAGGVIARLYVSEQPVWGQDYPGGGRVTTLVTLGSPHCDEKGIETGWFLTDEANRLAPGSVCADRIRCRAVVGRYLRGRQNGRPGERRAYRTYRFFIGEGNVWGDGIVPVRSAGLEGAETLILEGVGHSMRIGSGWYGGSSDIIRLWWPDGVGDAS
jgi:pimeloyl-ACP methyl ester carboxylesterase